MEVVPEVKAHNIDYDFCGGDLVRFPNPLRQLENLTSGDPADYCDEFTFSAGDGNGGNAKEGS